MVEKNSTTNRRDIELIIIYINLMEEYKFSKMLNVVIV